MKPGFQSRKWLEKKAKPGWHGYPAGTIAFYGPDNRRASKAVVGVISAKGAEPEMRRWFAESGDVRADQRILAEAASFLRESGVHSVAMTDGIIGCPHEEGIDYPEGERCPQCPYWAGRNRWTGEIEGS